MDIFWPSQPQIGYFPATYASSRHRLQEVITYRGSQDLVEKVRYYLEHDAEREEIVAAGQKASLSKHQYVKRILCFLKQLRFMDKSRNFKTESSDDFAQG